MNVEHQLLPAPDPASDLTPCALRGFALALFAIACGYAPLAVTIDEAGGYTYLFPPAARAARERYFASRDLLTRLQSGAEKTR
jgi:hypothetical protein